MPSSANANTDSVADAPHWPQNDQLDRELAEQVAAPAAAPAAQKQRPKAKLTAEQKAANREAKKAAKRTEYLAGRTYSPPPPAMSWVEVGLTLAALCCQPEALARWDPVTNFRGDIKAQKYKSAIVASALADANVAPSDWSPSGTPDGRNTSLDGGSRFRALVQFRQDAYPYCHNPCLAAPWLEQYDGLLYSELPEDARTRVDNIQMRMRVATQPLSAAEHQRYFESRQQTTVTTPGERLSAAGTCCWAGALFRSSQPTMEELELSGAQQDRRKGSFHTFLLVAYHALGHGPRVAPNQYELRTWMDGFEPADDAASQMEAALRAVVDLAKGVFSERSTAALPPSDKVSLALACSVLGMYHGQPHIAADLANEPFIIPASASGAATRSTASEDLVAAFRHHVCTLLELD
jgi:hypothetical protein